MTAITTRTVDVLVVEEELVFSLAALCQASGAQAWQVQALVVEGVLQPSGPRPEDWRFGGVALQRTRLALRLARDFELPVPGVAIVMDLLLEIDTLRARLPRA